MSGQNNDAEPPPQVPGHILRSLRRQQRRQPGLRRAGPRHPRLLRPRHRGQQGEDGLPPTVTMMCYSASESSVKINGFIQQSGSVSVVCGG